MSEHQQDDMLGVTSSVPLPYFDFGYRPLLSTSEMLLRAYPMEKARFSNTYAERIKALDIVLANMHTGETITLSGFSRIKKSTEESRHSIPVCAELSNQKRTYHERREGN